MKYVNDCSVRTSNYDIIQRSEEKPKLILRLRKACRECKESLSFNIDSYNINVRNNYNISINIQFYNRVPN